MNVIHRCCNLRSNRVSLQNLCKLFISKHSNQSGPSSRYINLIAGWVPCMCLLVWHFGYRSIVENSLQNSMQSLGQQWNTSFFIRKGSISWPADAYESGKRLPSSKILLCCKCSMFDNVCLLVPGWSVNHSKNCAMASNTYFSTIIQKLGCIEIFTLKLCLIMVKYKSVFTTSSIWFLCIQVQHVSICTYIPYIYMHAYIHTIHACMHAFMHTSIHLYMHTYMHAYMQPCIYI